MATWASSIVSYNNRSFSRAGLSWCTSTADTAVWYNRLTRSRHMLFYDFPRLIQGLSPFSVLHACIRTTFSTLVCFSSTLFDSAHVHACPSCSFLLHARCNVFSFSSAFFFAGKRKGGVLLEAALPATPSDFAYCSLSGRLF